MTTGQPIRLLLVDDHPIVRAGIKGMLAGEEDFEVIGEASNGEEALSMITGQIRPDVVLMDLHMPTMDGITATARIKGLEQPPNVLVLTTYETDADIMKAIEAGATGYLLKDAPLDELCRAIRQTAKGEPILSPGVAARLMGRVRGSGEEALTGREVEVLELVARGTGNKEIAGHLHVSEATVKTHLVHIYEKLGVADRAAAVAIAIDRGMIRVGD